MSGRWRVRVVQGGLGDFERLRDALQYARIMTRHRGGVATVRRSGRCFAVYADGLVLRGPLTLAYQALPRAARAALVLFAVAGTVVNVVEGDWLSVALGALFVGALVTRWRA